MIVRKIMSYSCTTEHSFYCINCGNKGIPIPRNKGFSHKKMHRKKLYCIFCKQEINHVECKTIEDVEKFKQDFKNGAYLDEAKESLSYMRMSSIR